MEQVRERVGAPQFIRALAIGQWQGKGLNWVSPCFVVEASSAYLGPFVLNGYLGVIVRVLLCQEVLESFLDIEGEYNVVVCPSSIQPVVPILHVTYKGPSLKGCYIPFCACSSILAARFKSRELFAAFPRLDLW